MITNKNLDILFHNLRLIKESSLILMIISKKVNGDPDREKMVALSKERREVIRSKILLYGEEILFMGCRGSSWILPELLYKAELNSLDICGLLKNNSQREEFQTTGKQQTIGGLRKDFIKKSFIDSSKSYAGMPRVFEENLKYIYGENTYTKMTMKLFRQIKNKKNKIELIEKCSRYKGRS